MGWMSIDDENMDKYVSQHRDGKRLDQSCWMGMFRLILLTDVTLPYKLQYISLETLPSENILNLSISLQVYWMTCQRRIMRNM
jgi:hypothetical protein